MMSPNVSTNDPGVSVFSVCFPCPLSGCAGVKATSLERFYLPDFIKSVEQISETQQAQKCPWGLKVNLHCQV